MVIHIWAADEISLHGRQTLPVHSSSFLFIFPLFFPLTPLSSELEIKPLCPHLLPSVSRGVCVCLQIRGWWQNRLLWKQFMFASSLMSQSKVDLTAHPCPGSKIDKSDPSGSNTMEDSPSWGTAFFFGCYWPLGSTTIHFLESANIHIYPASPCCPELLGLLCAMEQGSHQDVLLYKTGVPHTTSFPTADKDDVLQLGDEIFVSIHKFNATTYISPLIDYILINTVDCLYQHKFCFP